MDKYQYHPSIILSHNNRFKLSKHLKSLDKPRKDKMKQGKYNTSKQKNIFPGHSVQRAECADCRIPWC